MRERLLAPVVIAALTSVLLWFGIYNVALSAAGVSGHGLRATWGAALRLLSAVVYAGGVVAQRPALREYSALSVTWLGCTVAAVACLPRAPGPVSQLGRTSAATVAGRSIWALARWRSALGPGHSRSPAPPARGAWA